MTGPEALQNVQFVTVNGQRLAVLSADHWDSLVEWLETLEDIDAVKEAQDALAAASGSREKAGWLRWDDVRDQIE